MAKKNEEVKETVTTTIAEYSQTEAALGELRQRLQGATYEVTTTAGMDLARKDRRELVTLRTSLEVKRKEIKAPALERCRLIDSEAKRITDELLKLEKPIDEQIKAEEERKSAIKVEKERIERERVAAIHGRIDKLKGLPLLIVGMASGELEIFIGRVEAQQIGADFAEFRQEAEDTKGEVVAKLKESLATVLAKEAEDARIKAEQEAEAQRLESERKESERKADLQEQVNSINGIALKASTIYAIASVADLEQLQEEAGSVDTSTFEEYREAADNAKVAAVSSIQTLIEQKKEALAMREAREKFEREQTRRNRINQIANIPMMVFGNSPSAADLRRTITETKAIDCGDDSEMAAAVVKAVEDLQRLLVTVEKQEAADAESMRQKEEQDRQERQRIEKEAEEKRLAELDEARKQHEAEMEAATADHVTTLRSILAATEDSTLSAPAALQLIAELAKRGIERAA